MSKTSKKEKLAKAAEYRANQRPEKFPKNTVRSRRAKARELKGEGNKHPTLPEELKEKPTPETFRRAPGSLDGHAFSMPLTNAKRPVMKIDPTSGKILKIYESAMAAAEDIAGPGLTISSAHSGIQAAAKTCQDKKQHLCGGFKWEWKPLAKGARNI